MPAINRRDLLRYGAAATVVTATAAGVQNLGVGGSAAQNAAPPATDPRDFDIEYRGKKIKGAHDGKTRKHKVSINGRKLAVMEIELPVAEGAPGAVIGVVSALTHYEPFLLDEDRHRDGLLKMAKKAVDTLGDAELADLAGTEHDHGN
jgi:hypothetical protein